MMKLTMLSISSIVLLCFFMQDPPDFNKDWLGKRVYPAHSGTINMLLPDSKEVEWPDMSDTALGKKGLFVEVRYKNAIGRVRMQEVVHEDRAIEYFQIKVDDEPEKYFWKLMHALVLVELDADNSIKYLDKYVDFKPSCEMLYLRANYHFQPLLSGY